jgi:hypothetical protein
VEASPRRWNRGLFVGVAVVAVLLLAAGSYLLGKASGEDLDAARSAGSAAGQQAGAAKGAEQGYSSGHARGQRQAYRASYTTAYKVAYGNAFDDAGLTPPDEITVPSASP